MASSGDWDEDAAVEALRRIQPSLDALVDQLVALENRTETVTHSVVHPVKVVETFEDGTESVYDVVYTLRVQ